MQPASKPSENKVGCPQMHLGKVTILHISLRSIVEYFAIIRFAHLQNFLQAIRYAHLAKEVTFKGPILHISLRSTFAKSF